MRRVPWVTLAVVVTLLIVAPVAVGHDGGEGLYGETNDKVVTNAGFILIGFFPAFVLVISLIQWRLDKRKEARKAAAKTRATGEIWRGGW